MFNVSLKNVVGFILVKFPFIKKGLFVSQSSELPEDFVRKRLFSALWLTVFAVLGLFFVFFRGLPGNIFVSVFLGLFFIPFLVSSCSICWFVVFCVIFMVFFVGSRCFVLHFFFLVCPSISTVFSSILFIMTQYFPESLPAVFTQILPTSIFICLFY